MLRDKLLYYPSVTREPFPTQRADHRPCSNPARSAPTSACRRSRPEHDRVMLCGSEAMNADVKALLEARGFTEGSNNSPGTYVVEKAFVTK